MDHSQAKALAAIQPFVYQATTTKNPSPRFLAELIKGAISAPGAYVFTELLQLPDVQLLRETESEPWLTLLEIFSWGTYEEYKANPSLPALDASQTLKLRQLTLLTLASPVAPSSATNPTPASNLTYAALLSSLSLTSPAELESLITTSIYSGLLVARLSPASNPPTVHITSVAPLRDLRPQSLSALLQILQTWESRCVSVISDLEAQITAIRATAQQRGLKEKKRQDMVDSLVLSNDKLPTSNDNGVATGARTARGAGQRLPSKRDLDQQMEGEGDDYEDEYEGMDLDEGIGEGPGGTWGSAMRGGGGGSARGAKRNRGRGSK